MRTRGPRDRSEKGATIVEFALCFLLCFTVLYGIMEFSRVVYSRTVLAAATREATRYAIVHGSKSGIPATEEILTEKVRRWAIGLNTAAINVDATWIPNNAPKSKVRVVTTYTITPFSNLIFPGSITVGSRSEMVISQ
jgi:Flp pilus assembly protein TadG